MNDPVMAPPTRKRPGKMLHRVLPVVARCALSIVLIGGAIAAVMAMGRGRRAEANKSVVDPVPVVEVAAVEPHDSGIDFTVDGVVIPFREVEVPSEVAGRIDFKSDDCRVGHTVTKGQLLLKIDPQDYDLEIRRLEEDLNTSKANLRELSVETAARKRHIELAKEDLAIKQREVARYEKVEDPGVYSKSELDAARLKELQARDAVQTEHDQLELLEARQDRYNSACDLALAKLDKARLDLARTEVHSPIDGVVTREAVEQGGYVQRGGTAVVIQDTSCMEIRCSLQMHEMHWLLHAERPGESGAEPLGGYRLPETPAMVDFTIGRTRYTWQGNMAYFDGARVDQQTRMVPCRVYVRDPLDVQVDGPEDRQAEGSTPIALMVGMFVSVHVHAQPALALLRLPEVAVQPGNTVWTVRPRGEGANRQYRLAKSAIEVVHADNESVLAYSRRSDLAAGDLLVISPLASPTEDAVVEILGAP